MNDKEFLEHFGIPGMHWGRKKGSSTSSEKASTNSEDHNKKMALKGKKLHELSNDELRAYTQRMSLEKSYKEFSKTELSPGRKFVNDLVVNTGKQAVNQFVSAHSKKLVDDLIKKTMKE